MQTYSKTAWDIASLYSRVLASETRDLAAHIDKAIAGETERLLERNSEHEARYDALEAKEEYHRRDAERLRAAQLSPEERNRLRQWYNALDDANPNFLEEADKALALKIVGVPEQQEAKG